jgi:hypothetical protein
MINEQEQIVKTTHSANFLVQDLRELAKSSNALLAEMALEILQHAVKIEQRLQRICQWPTELSHFWPLILSHFSREKLIIQL